MSLIIETDIGHDPDDFFAICYLAAAGVNIRAILVSPGDPDQIAIARFICRELGLNIPIGAGMADRTKRSSGSIHHWLLQKYGQPLDASPDCLSHEILETMDLSDTELFVIGPLNGVGEYFRRGGKPLKRATMQGGFVPYSVQRPVISLDKFEGKPFMPTFNLNGDRKGADLFLKADMPRQMVGKNVCHSVVFDRKRFARFTKPINRASELFCEAAEPYLAQHDSKKFHDPTAAVCHLHPEVGVWMDGKTVRRESGWTTVPGEDKVLVDLDHVAMWSHLENWT